MSVKNWTPEDGDFRKSDVRSEHRRFKKRAKIEKYLVYLLVFIFLILLIIYLSHS